MINAAESFLTWRHFKIRNLCYNIGRTLVLRNNNEVFMGSNANKQFRVAMLLRVSRDIARIRQIAGNQYLGCTFDYYEADTLDDLRTTFERLQNSYDGILTSGILSDRIISYDSAGQNIPHRCFTASVENYYRVILLQLQRNPGLSLGDIRLDMMLPGQSLSDIIEGNSLAALMEQENELIAQLTPNQVMEFEKNMIHRYRQTIETQQYKLFITRSGLAARTFEEYNAPYISMELTAHEVFKAIKGLRRDMELGQLRAGQVAAICFDVGSEPSSEKMEKLESALMLFGQKEGGKSLIFRRIDQHFEALTDAQTLSLLTQNHTCCKLTEYLRDATGYPVAVGYGTGQNAQAARENAAMAAMYARGTEPKLAQSFWIDSEGQITALQGRQHTESDEKSEASRVFEPAINEIAKRSHLSSRTIFNLIIALKKQNRMEAGSDWISRELSISPRMANKILANLEKAGYAQVAGKYLLRSKGRPTNLYSFRFDAPESEHK